jgi:glutamine---fructose-6-phosphate transaminase (isomerizing)
MCGIFGAVIAHGSALARDHEKRKLVERLFDLSASRGKEAAGLALANDHALAVFKEPMPAKEMIRLPEFRALVHQELRRGDAASTLAFIGHSRLVTDGAREVNLNNQPVITSGIVGIHNGIIVNHAQVWAAHREISRALDVDSEVIFALLRANLDRGLGLQAAVAATFGELRGAASIAALLTDRDQLVLATNNGSLYHRGGAGSGSFVFASENFILRSYLDGTRLGDEVGRGDGVHVQPGEGVLIDLKTLAVTPFAFAAPAATVEPARATPRRIEDRSPELERPRGISLRSPDLGRLASQFPYTSTTYTLRRCTRCVLPDTMPFIEFDADGVCSYCHNHRPLKMRGRDALEEIVGPHRRKDGRPDCVLGISGGRDSMYGLHYVKTVLKMNPVAFTYDWGMVTDLARRNVSRICGKLGIEHILVSADIDRKRHYIRQNVEAWLRRPSLGTVPLFMAGDKAYFHHLNKVRAQVGTPLGILCENLLERTDFKSGFSGVRPEIVDDVRAYTLKVGGKLRMLGFYVAEFLRNPAYLNSSLVDSALAYYYFYIIKRSYTNLYGYVPWVEDVVNKTLIEEYDFELSPDTSSTWRIGDGTAAFYNYIYHTIAGFSEHDTLRSNQVREGVITRDEALARIDRENQPRFASIQWYLDVLHIERPLEEVVEIINQVPRLYRTIPDVRGTVDVEVPAVAPERRSASAVRAV